MNTRYAYLKDAAARRQLATFRSSAAAAVVAGVLALGVATRPAERVAAADPTGAESVAPLPATAAFEPIAPAAAVPIAATPDPRIAADLRASLDKSEPSVF